MNKRIWHRKNAEWEIEVFDDGKIIATECKSGQPYADGEKITMRKEAAKSLSAILSLIP